MVEALTSWAAQDEAGASFARHREVVCALGLGKDLEIEELTKKVKELEAFSAAEEKQGGTRPHEPATPPPAAKPSTTSSPPQPRT